MDHWALQNISENEIQLRKTQRQIPSEDEVLIEVHFAPINPSDVMAMKGMYASFTSYEFPVAHGNEGSGIVVSSGGIKGKHLVGKKVAFTRVLSNGAFQQFTVARVDSCFDLQDDVSMEQASMHYVNPMTAICLTDIIINSKCKAAI